MNSPSLTPLQLYRQMLRAAQYFPSIRQPQVYQAIREEFRAKRHLPVDAVPAALRLGVLELHRLRVYRSVRAPNDVRKPNPARDWEVRL
ncbi:hypothetical protein CDCA_CDCA07G2139 [Cyanidium caldarium]|uniref:Complex 1 LYR protein domain-containing protein n=1 Tax=Cyanidium caldarium TaxID=2771 RepID=A0AAV9IV00_CYACA|nr:hypothetical protein CDCA_CDCA07G2139 [Cyanidium caldarium]